MRNSKEYLSIWQVNDRDDFNRVVETGTFKTIKEFALERFEVMNVDEMWKLEDLERGDEQLIFDFLEQLNYNVYELCSVTKDDFTENVIEVGIYYYIDEETGKKVYDVEEMMREFEIKLEELPK